MLGCRIHSQDGMNRLKKTYDGFGRVVEHDTSMKSYGVSIIQVILLCGNLLSFLSLNLQRNDDLISGV